MNPLEIAANRNRIRAGQAFTLVEVLVSLVIAGVLLVGALGAYALAAQRSEWLVTSAAADRAATRELERWRSARWDAYTNTLQPGVYVLNGVPLDLAQTSTGGSFATNRTTISLVSASPPLALVSVECIWTLPDRGPFTNSVMTYRAPTQ